MAAAATATIARCPEPASTHRLAVEREPVAPARWRRVLEAGEHTNECVHVHPLLGTARPTASATVEPADEAALCVPRGRRRHTAGSRRMRVFMSISRMPRRPLGLHGAAPDREAARSPGAMPARSDARRNRRRCRPSRSPFRLRAGRSRIARGARRAGVRGLLRAPTTRNRSYITFRSSPATAR